ncbi:MAG: transposase [Firmicutes bacterium ML8_F2]|nr:MAG: transposase [Firmicutes bacterium ML8_F2]
MKIEVDLYQQIRYLHEHEQLSQRAIAKRLGVSRNTVKKYFLGHQVPWQRQGVSGRTKYVITAEIIEFITSCLTEDELENVTKQSHTAKRIYDRLIKELDFSGGESTVREIVAELKNKQSKVYIPLSFEPGEAYQIDWGEVTVYLDGVKIKLYIFCMRECYSADIFVKAFFRPNQESFLEAQIEGMEFFGGAARRMIFDNAKVAVKEGFGAHAKVQDRYKALAAHYAFGCDFCNISAGHEKGLVEGLVGWARRNIFVPIPRVANIDQLNAEILRRCIAYRTHRISGREQTVGQMALVARAAMTKLPPYRFDSSRTLTSPVNTYSTVRFDYNNYSVPVIYAGKEVAVKGYGNIIVIYHRGREIARYVRCYEQGKTKYQLEHYLDLIEKRPRSVFNARPVKDNISQKILSAGRRLSGPREMVKLLRLCVDHGQDEVMRVLEKIPAQNLSIAQIQGYLVAVSEKPGIDVHSEVKVPKPQFKNYDALLMKEAAL